MNQANICPKCKKYILGTYCCICKEDIRSMSYPTNPFEGTPFEDIFKPFTRKDDDRKTKDRE